MMASLAEWVSMGEHGVYVWSAWGITALFMLGLTLHARLERRQLLKHLKRVARRQASPPQQRGHDDDPKA
jgi:heme exporter protein D